MKIINNFKIILIVVVAFVGFCLTAHGTAFEPISINSEQYNKWSSSKHFVAGLEALDDGSAQDAVDNFSLELKKHPSNGYALCNLAQARVVALNEAYYEGFEQVEAETISPEEYVKNFASKVRAEIKELERGLTLLPAEDKESQCMAHLAVARIYMDWFDADSVNILNSLNSAVACHPCGESYFERIRYNAQIHRDSLSYIEDDARALYELYPENQSIVGIMAFISYSKKDIEGFLKYYDEYQTIAKRDEVLPDTQLDMFYAKYLTDEGRREEALNTLLKVMSLYYDEEPLKAILLLTKDEQLAHIAQLKIKQMQFAEEGDNDIWDASLGYILKGEKDYNAAIAQFQQVLSRVPGNTMCLSQIADCYYMMGDIDNAKLYTHACSMITGDNKYQNLLYNLGEFDELLANDKVKNENLDVFKYDGDYYASQAAMHIMKKDHQQAIAILDKAKAVNEETIEVNYQRGVALKKMGREEEARAYFEKAFEAGASEIEHGVDLFYLASSIELGKPDTTSIERLAKMWYKKQEEMIPGYSDGDGQLAYEVACLYAMMGDNDNAMKFMENHFEHGEMPYNFGLIRQDWRLDSIKALPEFQDLANKYYFEWKNQQSTSSK